MTSQVYRSIGEKLESWLRKLKSRPRRPKNMSVDEVSWLKYHRYPDHCDSIQTSKRSSWNAQAQEEVLNRYTKALDRRTGEKESNPWPWMSEKPKSARLEEYAKKALIVRQVPRDPETDRPGCDAPIRASKAREEQRFDLMEMMGFKQRFHLAEKQVQSNGKGNQNT